MTNPKLIDKFKQSKFAEFMREKVKPIAGDVLEIVGDVTGIDTIERVGEMLNKRKEADDEYKALSAEFEMKKLEWQMELEGMKMEIGLAEMKAENEDRASARSREIDFTKLTGKRDWLMAVVVITGLLMTIGVIACLVFIQIPEANQRLADMCFGAVLSIGTSIFGYYIGSSRGSHAKQQTIDRVMK